MSNLKNRVPKLFIIIYIALLFLAISGYVFFQHMMRLDYYPFFYGTGIENNSKVFARVFSKDGFAVKNPCFVINGKKQCEVLVDMENDFNSVMVSFEGFEKSFPVNSDMLRKSKPYQYVFYKKSDENSNTRIAASNSQNGKKIYLLPETFAIYPEFDTKVHLFCYSKNEKCSDNVIHIGKNSFDMKDGHALFTYRQGPNHFVEINFSDGDKVNAVFPYTGKMYNIASINGKLILKSLIDFDSVFVDCYKNESWVFTKKLSSDFNGVTLPSDYLKCTRIQVSNDPSEPASSFAVFTTDEKKIPDDSYYSELYKEFSDNENIRDIIEKYYSNSYFIKLPLLYNGYSYKPQFDAEKGKILVRYLIGIAVMFGVAALFIAFYIISNIKEVRDDDGEIVSHSKMKYYLFLLLFLSAFIIYAAAFIYYLYKLA